MAKVSPMMILPPLLFAGLVAVFLWGMGRQDPDALPSARAGGPAPELSVVELGDHPGFDAADLSAPGVKLVNFWASWCAPCRAEHPNLKALAEEGITIYGIDYKDPPEKGIGFLAEMGSPYAGVMADAKGRTGLDWGIYGVPETFVIDGDGKIVLRFAGPLTQRSIEDTLRPALAKAAGE
ncbi:DsbE family thiol:disulfide interchange protein [Frigidibacter sp. ROC022]|uniref:DsbE family thiol:disulfide interchange protein n=1 Tax=Frigidibacter sp. ROC022 TaxID=2971796 RepID=UPI00215A6022|nr:DsbE family thiol:disulfide interchange protein [Frigidibacter sp. ROC022]MCR8726415.1 DsbE family thiol:disulfide interchange protein [Frigidibacter sp. ROC022]